jgi:integrase/recombinase XerC
MPTGITLREYLPKVREGLSPGTIMAWGKYLDLLDAVHGVKAMADILPSDIESLARAARSQAVRRRDGQGTSAAEHLIAAARHVLGRALLDGLVERNVALLVSKPARAEGSRYALSKPQTDELFEVAAGVGERTVWMLRWLLETGSRREGLLELEPGRVRPATRTVTVVEKGRKPRTLPVSADLAGELADGGSSLYAWTRKKLEVDWTKLGQVTEWGAELGLSAHWMRHCAITRMERASSFTVAAAWAGHSLSSIVTSTYVRIGLPQLVCGWMVMTGQRHPLHQCEDTLDCFVAARRPELLGTARVVGHQENGRLLRPLSEIA